MAENENLASFLVKSGLISIFTNSPIGYFSKFPNVWWTHVGGLARQKQRFAAICMDSTYVGNEHLLTNH